MQAVADICREIEAVLTRKMGKLLLHDSGYYMARIDGRDLDLTVSPRMVYLYCPELADSYHEQLRTLRSFNHEQIGHRTMVILEKESAQ